MDYNKKIDYQICKNLVIGSTEENEYRFKQIFFGKQNPISRTEIKIVEFKKLFELLKKSNDCYITLNTIYEALYKTTLKEEERKLIKKVLAYHNEDLVYQRLAESCCFDDKLAFIAFVYNAKRISEKKYPIIFYHDLTIVMYSYLRSGNSEKGLIILKQMKEQTDVQNQINSFTNREQIVTKILSSKSQLNNEFDVKKVYLYGSCARDEMSEYSDVDIICITNVKTHYQALYQFLRSLFQRHVDLKIGDELSELALNKNISANLLEVF